MKHAQSVTGRRTDKLPTMSCVGEKYDLRNCVRYASIRRRIADDVACVSMLSYETEIFTKYFIHLLLEEGTLYNLDDYDFEKDYYNVLSDKLPYEYQRLRPNRPQHKLFRGADYTISKLCRTYKKAIYDDIIDAGYWIIVDYIMCTGHVSRSVAKRYADNLLDRGSWNRPPLTGWMSGHFRRLFSEPGACIVDLFFIISKISSPIDIFPRLTRSKRTVYYDRKTFHCMLVDLDLVGADTSPDDFQWGDYVDHVSGADEFSTDGVSMEVQRYCAKLNGPVCRSIGIDPGACKLFAAVNDTGDTLRIWSSEHRRATTNICTDVQLGKYSPQTFRDAVTRTPIVSEFQTLTFAECQANRSVLMWYAASLMEGCIGSVNIYFGNASKRSLASNWATIAEFKEILNSDPRVHLYLVDELYTSSYCHSCGSGYLEVLKHTASCKKCNVKGDRDKNAAINILQIGIDSIK